MSALGLVETKGLTGAIEGADAMLKAADVRLLEKNLAGGGLVTITITGEVAAVKAAVDAAAAAIGRVTGAVLVSQHVIARPDVELEHILALKPGDAADVASRPETQNSAVAATPVTTADEAEDIIVVEEIVVDVSAPEAPRHSAAQLKKMSVTKLRHLAENLDTGLSPEKIASADRKTLIEAITHAYKHREE